jgi:hypothetical protein
VTHGTGLAVARRQYRDRRIVGVEDRRRHHLAADQRGERRHPPRDMADPIGQRGALDLGRLWTYVADERPWQGGRAPAAYYRFSPDWHAVYPRDPAQKAALHRCCTENHQFNRMSAGARRDCYAKWLVVPYWGNG